jgi:DNA polymerase-3 subunit delta'
VLEEPPARAVLILVSHQPARLLPTIRSRCRTLRLKPLGSEALNAALAQAGVEVEDGTALAELAGGSAGEALRLSTLDGPALYAALVRLMGQAPNMDRQAARAFVESVTQRGADEKLALAVRLLDLALARLARTGAGLAPEHPAAKGETDAFAKLALAAPSRRWAELQQALSARLAHGLAVNVDPGSLLLDALLQVNEAARSPA